MIKVKLENDKAFVRMLKGYLTSTSKDAAFAVNNKLYSVALTAIKRTKKAGKKNIERMWVPDSSVVDRKSKKRNSKRIHKGHPPLHHGGNHLQVAEGTQELYRAPAVWLAPVSAETRQAPRATGETQTKTQAAPSAEAGGRKASKRFGGYCCDQHCMD